MSTVFLIDQNTGIIKRELIATASYREEGLLTVKPRNSEEERLWRQFSKNSEKIAALTSEVEKLERQVQEKELLEKEAVQQVVRMFSELEKSEHEKYCPRELREIRAEWEQAGQTFAEGRASQAAAVQAQRTLRKCRMLKRKIAGAQLKEAERQRQMEESLKRICGKLTAMETMCLQIQTDEGMETMDAPADLLSSHGLQALQGRLDEIIRRGLESGGIQQEELAALERDADRLPGEVQEIYVTHTIRIEEAEAVRERLLKRGWTVEVSMGEQISDDVVLFLENQAQERVAVTFPLLGKIKIDSPLSWDGERRNCLQMLVMHTLKRSGVPELYGYCTDGKDSDIRAEDIVDPDERQALSTPAPTPAASRTVEKKRPSREAGGSE